MLSFFVNLETIKKTLGAGGNVLLPVDTAGRVFELILILEQVSRENTAFLSWVNCASIMLKYKNHEITFNIGSLWWLQYWTDKSLNYPIFFLTYVASSTIDYVKSFLEWMSDSIAKSFEQNRENPFLLK
jgi:cleavage and polyadenylation specificity factor subunit 2